MRNLEKEKLDEIGKALIKAGSIHVQNIDEILAKPDLFDGIRTRISSETSARKRTIGFMRPTFSAAGTIILIAVVSFAYFSLRSKPRSVAVTRSSPSVKSSDTMTIPGPKSDAVISERPDVHEPAPIRSERISVSRQPERAMKVKPVAASHVDETDDFYALSYAGDPSETERGGRIVRVDISRASLFAMGFDLPLENESETVRADLLIGNDGVTRAVRVVK